MLMCFATSLWATDIKVTPETFKSAYDAAVDGDVLLMADGNYGTEFTFPSGKTVTLRADEGAKPVLLANIRGNSTDIAGGQLIMDGLDINHDTGDNYLMNFDKMGNIKGIVCRNCTIRNIGRCFLRTSTEGYHIELIEFDNCLIYSNGQNGWNFLYPKHTVGTLTVRNTTFYNYSTGESFFCPNSANDGTTALNACIENCTFYNWGKDSGRAILNLGSKYGADSKFVFTNNIIAEPDGAPQPKPLSCSGGELTATNNLLVNMGDYSISGGKKTVTDITLQDLGLEALSFPDPATGDFSILSTSPLATAGTDGKPLGDPRWVKTLADAVHIATSVQPEGAGTTAPAATDVEKGSTLTLQATANYGYEFIKWVDSNGNTVAETNPAEITVSADMEYTAVFSKLTMHTLTVNKDGDGAKWGNVEVLPQYPDNRFVEGTKVSATVISNPVTSFLQWEDGSADKTRVIEMDEDKTITATFDVIPFVVAWDFSSGRRENSPAEYALTTDNTGMMQLFNADGSTTSWGNGEREFGGTSKWCARRYTDADKLVSAPRYFQARFSAKGYTNIRVSSKVAVDNECALSGQKMQYSTDGTTFHDIAGTDLTGQVNAGWIDMEATLPELDDAEKETIYIRWVADTESKPLSDSPSGTEGFYLADVMVYADQAIADDHDAPVLLNTQPAEGSATVGANGNITLYFNERVKAGQGAATLGGQEIQPVFGSKTVAFAYHSLPYGTEHEFVLPEGAVTDMSGNAFAGMTLRFSTMQRPQPKARTYDVVVAADGSGDVLTVQEAIDRCPAGNAQPWLVFIKNGRYHGVVRIPENKPFIHLIGQDKVNTVVTFKVHAATEGSDEKYRPATLGVDGDFVVGVKADDFYAENISFENAWGVDMQEGPMALAMKNEADRAAFYNCRFRSYQDTWYNNAQNPAYRTYATNCHIEGAVDYFYGEGEAYIENSVFMNQRSGSVITAPSHKDGTRWGFVFANDTIDAIASGHDGKLKLGRPWNSSPIAVWLNTVCVAPVAPEGWTDMGVVPKLFAEYNTMDKDGNPVDLSNRKDTYHDRATDTYGKCQNVLSAEEAAAYTYEAVLSGNDHWNPRKYFESVDAPAEAKFTSERVSWNASSYAICYVVYRNGEMVAQTTGCSYTLPSSAGDVITVCAVGEYGHQSRPATAVYTTADGIGHTEAAQALPDSVYNAAGQRTPDMKKGINIVVKSAGGKKTATKLMRN